MITSVEFSNSSVNISLASSGSFISSVLPFEGLASFSKNEKFTSFPPKPKQSIEIPVSAINLACLIPASSVSP